MHASSLHLCRRLPHPLCRKCKSRSLVRLLVQKQVIRRCVRWMATQDPKLREVLNGVPGVPCLFLTHNGLFVETPSEASKGSAAETELNTQGIAKWELKTEALKHLPEMLPSLDRSIFRRKRAKGPNPLSCLRKRAKNTETTAPLDTMQVKTKRRRRKRQPSEQHISATAPKTRKAP